MWPGCVLPKMSDTTDVSREKLRQMGNNELLQFTQGLGLVGGTPTPKQVLRAVESAELVTAARGL